MNEQIRISDNDVTKEQSPKNCMSTIKAPQYGDLCPNCQAGRLDYDGLLNLTCPNCDHLANTGGAFT